MPFAQSAPLYLFGILCLLCLFSTSAICPLCGPPVLHNMFPPLHFEEQSLPGGEVKHAVLRARVPLSYTNGNEDCFMTALHNTPIVKGKAEEYNIFH